MGPEIVLEALASGVDEARRAGYPTGLVSYSTEGLEERVESCAGVQVIRPWGESDPVIDLARACGKPVVTVPGQIGVAEELRPPSVGPDALPAARALLDSFGSGATNALLITASFDHEVLMRLKSLFADWCEENGVAHSVLQIEHSREPAAAVKPTMRRMLDEDFDLLVGATGSLAIAAYEGAQLADAAPRVVALVDSPSLDFMEFPISGVRVDSERVAREAMKMLIRMIEDETYRPEDLLIESSVFERR